MRTRFLFAIDVAALAAVVVTLSACASSEASAGVHRPGSVITYAREFPPGVKSAPQRKPSTFVTWARRGARIYVTTYGSGSCPKLPRDVQAEGRHRVVITTAVEPGRDATACTYDLAATTSTVALPTEVDSHGPLDVDIDGKTFRLAPR